MRILVEALDCTMQGLFGKYEVILAPMAGVTDIAMRALCEEQGADIAFTEMVSAKGLSYANEKTRHLLDRASGESTVAVQIFGHEPETMAAQASWIEDELGSELAYIDINMGCPARKIVSKGDGSALMKAPMLAADIVAAVKKAVSCPVTAKFRRGWSMGDETAPEFAKRLEQAGVDGVTVHGRFSEQMYRGASCKDAIKRVKQSVSIPVVGNGDIANAEDALSMVFETGCDAIMIARGAQGNPWIFSQVKAALAGSDIPKPPTPIERIRMARRHARLLEEREGRNIVRMRKHAMWYVSGLPGASKARGLFNYCSTLDDFERVFDELEKRQTAASEPSSPANS